MSTPGNATVQIPAILSEAFAEEHDPSGLQRWVLEALVLTAGGDNLVSTGEAAELLGLGYFETLALIKNRCMPLKISDEEFELDQADLRKISTAINRQ